MITYITMYGCDPERVKQIDTIVTVFLGALRSTQGDIRSYVEGDTVSLHNPPHIDEGGMLFIPHVTLPTVRIEMEAIVRAFGAKSMYTEVMAVGTFDMLYFQWEQGQDHATQIRAFQALPHVIRWRDTQ